MTQAYNDGFVAKCAEYGVSPALVKFARYKITQEDVRKTLQNAPKDPSTVDNRPRTWAAAKANFAHSFSPRRIAGILGFRGKSPVRTPSAVSQTRSPSVPDIGPAPDVPSPIAQPPKAPAVKLPEPKSF